RRAPRCRWLRAWERKPPSARQAGRPAGRWRSRQECEHNESASSRSSGRGGSPTTSPLKPAAQEPRMILWIIPPGMASNPKDFLPLKPVELIILIALSEAEQHGYGLTQAIESRTDGAVHLEPGNLYKVLKRLVSDGLIEAAGHRP